MFSQHFSYLNMVAVVANIHSFSVFTKIKKQFAYNKVLLPERNKIKIFLFKAPSQNSHNFPDTKIFWQKSVRSGDGPLTQEYAWINYWPAASLNNHQIIQ